MNLTQKQESFCTALLEADSASEAYRRAYNAENMTPATINRKAKELMDNGKIAARVAVLREKAAELAVYSLVDHLERLRLLSELAESKENYAAAIRAEELRGRASGFYVERIEHKAEVDIAACIMAARKRLGMSLLN